MKWIKVTDEMPDEKKIRRILVYSKAGNTFVLHRDYAEWRLKECEYENGGEFSGESVDFTHWMALPKPPEES